MEEGIAYYRLSPLFEEVIGIGETDRTALINMVIDVNEDEPTKHQIELLVSDLLDDKSIWNLSKRLF